MISEDKLTVFLYILLRDYLPVGTVTTILKENIQVLGSKDPEFSDRELAVIAERVVKSLSLEKNS